MDYKSIPLTNIATELGLKKSSNGNWHCFNTDAHKHGDKNASLNISDAKNAFICFGCGTKGNSIEFIKKLLMIDELEAFKWLKKHFSNTNSPNLNKSPNKQATEHYINDIERIKQSKDKIKSNIFCKGLLLIGIPEKHLINSNIGHGKNNNTLFFYNDYKGNYCNIKAISYQEDLHRNKDTFPRYLFKKEEGYKIPLFNEDHLKNVHGNTPVILVESEKTAIIASYVMPDKIWLATGGTNGLTEEKAKVLLGRKVFIFFDSDEAGRSSAKRTLSLLKKLNIQSKIIDLFKNNTNGQDIADYLIEQFRQLQNEISKLNKTEKELFEERAAIMEFDGGLFRYEADKQALKNIKVN